jgi:predicted lactoylglutathione lyase
MVALQVETPETVKAVYDTALAHGGSDEGAPGPRGEDGFHAAYFRDPDGNKLNVFCMVKPA